MQTSFFANSTTMDAFIIVYSQEQPLTKQETRPQLFGFLPASLQPDQESSSSLRRISALALAEKKPFSIAVGLVCHHFACRKLVGISITELLIYTYQCNICLLFSHELYPFLFSESLRVLLQLNEPAPALSSSLYVALFELFLFICFAHIDLIQHQLIKVKVAGCLFLLILDYTDSVDSILIGIDFIPPG
jgi:hypothetical protein